MLGVPVGFFTSVYLAKIASPKVRGVIETAVSLLAGIPSVVYGLVVYADSCAWYPGIV